MASVGKSSVLIRMFFTRKHERIQMKWDRTLYTQSTSLQGSVELTIGAMSGGAVAVVATATVAEGLHAPGTLQLFAI